MRAAIATGSKVVLFEGVSRLMSVDSNKRVVFSLGERRSK